MKDTQVILDLQAYVDGELDAARRSEVERLLDGDAGTRQIVDGLRQIARLVRENEPIATVPATREFYWSQIQRRIAAEENRGSRPKAASDAIRWLRWLAPALGVAAVAVVLSLPKEELAGQEIADATTMTFRSDTDGLTLHWLE
jgi:anti-sigma factor RsiW